MKNFGQTLERIKHIGHFEDGKLVCDDDCPNAKHIPTANTTSTPLPEPMEATGNWEDTKCNCRCHSPLVTTHLCPNCFDGRCARSEIARAIEEERQAWLRRERCTNCGGEKKTGDENFIDMCSRCLEEA